MKHCAVLFALCKADFLERTRRASFRIILCLVFALGYAVYNGQVFIQLQNYRGLYNSAWIGSLMALVISFVLGIFGFYLVKGAVQEDQRSGVGQILASTPLSRSGYLIGKWLSNFAILAALVLALGLSGWVMQVLQHEDAHVQVWALMAPLLFIALPMMALVAALAVFFETIHWLKGGFGNIIYFFVFMGLFMLAARMDQTPWLDVTGMSLIGSDMRAAVRALDSSYNNSFVLGFTANETLKTFVYSGINWKPGLITARLAWLIVSLSLVGVGALFFDRFDSRHLPGSQRRSAKKSDLKPAAREKSGPQPALRLSPLSYGRRFHNHLLRLTWLEIQLLTKGLKWYWLAGMAGLWMACALLPAAGLGKFTFMLAALWPLLIWSQLGQREARCQVEPLVFPAVRPIWRLVVSSWLAGVCITAVMLSGVLPGRIFSGASLDILPWILAVLFIPTLALCLGTWSRSSKLFEVVYPILWYLGPFNPQNQLVRLDYLGIHPQAPVHSAPHWYAGGLVLLFILALVGRWRQFKN